MTITVPDAPAAGVNVSVPVAGSIAGSCLNWLGSETPTSNASAWAASFAGPGEIPAAHPAIARGAAPIAVTAGPPVSTGGWS